MKYEYVKGPTSDIVFKAYGKDMKELLENSAEALFSIICDIKQVKADNPVIMEVEGDDAKDLLFNWLQELIAAVDTDEMFFSKFDVKSIKENKIVVECYGEGIKPEKGNTLVKAVTNHLFDLEEKDGLLVATVSLDI